MNHFVLVTQTDIEERKKLRITFLVVLVGHVRTSPDTIKCVSNCMKMHM